MVVLSPFIGDKENQGVITVRKRIQVVPNNFEKDYFKDCQVRKIPIFLILMVEGTFYVTDVLRVVHGQIN